MPSAPSLTWRRRRITTCMGTWGLFIGVPVLLIPVLWTLLTCRNCLRVLGKPRKESVQNLGLNRCSRAKEAYLHVCPSGFCQLYSFPLQKHFHECLFVEENSKMGKNLNCKCNAPLPLERRNYN
uniref:Uncharacterized protein n=1 Tax=Cacopsylla melanoneura TaxID=428564 RepID=A0A8D8X658_9HEMI